MKTRILSQSEISIYNPQRMSDDVVERIFVVRTKDLAFFLERITEENEGSIPQQYLIIASRGMGKSTLLKRIEVALRNTELKQRFIPLLLPEEQYNLKNLGEFWLNCMDALADTLEQEGMNEHVAGIDQQIAEINALKDPQRVSQRAMEALMKWSRELQRRPVLLIDNLNLIFDRLSKEDHHQMRAELMLNNAPILIGASSSIIENTSDYQAAFYDAFQFYPLKKLSFDELLSVIKNLAELTGAQSQLINLEAHAGRLRSIFQLTGGNPRTASMLFRLIDRGFALNIKEDLEGLLDEITPLYKARFEELSQQHQIIIDAIALNWEPISLETLRGESGLENQQLSPQLKRLVDSGWINRRKTKRVKGDLYEIAERFFNIWFLMRRSSRRKKREVYCLARFLETFLGDQLESVASSRMNEPAEGLDHAYIDLALAEVTRDESKSLYLRERSYKLISKLAESDPDLRLRFDLPDNGQGLGVYSGNNIIPDWYWEFENLLNEKKFDEAEAFLGQRNVLENQAWHFYATGRYHQVLGSNLHMAEESFHKAIELNSDFLYAWAELGAFYIYQLKVYDKAHRALQRALEIDPKYVYALARLGNLYHDQLRRYAEAETMYNRAFEIDPKYVFAFYNLGDLYQDHLGRYAEAETIYKRALDIDPRHAYTLNRLGNLYQYHLRRYAEAETIYKRALETEPKYVFALYNLGNLYHHQLGRYAESEIFYKRALEIDPKYGYASYDLAYLYHHHFGRYAEAEIYYIRALEIDPISNYALNELGNLYQYHLERYAEAETCYKRVLEIDPKYVDALNGLGNLYQYHLSRYAESESCYKRALELDANYVKALNGLGNLYQYHLSRYAESESCYKRALELDANYVKALNGLSNLYQDHLSRYSESEFSYKRALELDPNNFYVWNNLGTLYQYHLSRYAESESCYHRAIELDPNYVNAWNNLGNLYKNELARYSDSESALLRAINLDPNSGNAWNSLGNLYQDHLLKYKEAEAAYQKCLAIDPQNLFAKYNLVFLYRDKLGEIEKAENIFKEIEVDPNLKDSYWLNNSLFDLYKQNLGQAKEALNKALAAVADGFKFETIDDWLRYAAVVCKLGFQDLVLEQIEGKNLTAELAPFYHAMRALKEKDIEDYVNSIAAELRDPVDQIIGIIQKHMDGGK